MFVVDGFGDFWNLKSMAFSDSDRRTDQRRGKNNIYFYYVLRCSSYPLALQVLVVVVLRVATTS